jgi:hypothetical protein
MAAGQSSASYLMNIQNLKFINGNLAPYFSEGRQKLIEAARSL